MDILMMRRMALLLLLSALVPPAHAAGVTGIKVISRPSGSTPPMQVEVSMLLSPSAIVSDNWGRNHLGTYQADILFRGGGTAPSQRTVDFGIRPSGNFAMEARLGDLDLGGQIVELEHCNYALSRRSEAFVAEGGTGTVSVTATSPGIACGWTVEESLDWVDLLTETDESGSGVVVYAVHPNPCGSEREGEMVVAGLTFDISQDADDPTVGIAPSGRSHAAEAGAGHEISVLAPCSIGWSAQAPAPWVHITSGSSGAGDGTVVYRLDANESIQSRSATVSIDGLGFGISQAGRGLTSDDFLLRIAPAVSHGGVALQWESLVGAAYQLQTNVPSGAETWGNVGGPRDGTGEPMEHSEVPLEPAKGYRLRGYQ